jgi:hypothetical protein
MNEQQLQHTISRPNAEKSTTLFTGQMTDELLLILKLRQKKISALHAFFLVNAKVATQTAFPSVCAPVKMRETRNRANAHARSIIHNDLSE